LSVIGPASALFLWAAACGSARPINGSDAGSGAGTSGGAGHAGTTGSSGSGGAGNGGSGGAGGGTGQAGTTGSTRSGGAGNDGSGGAGNGGSGSAGNGGSGSAGNGGSGGTSGSSLDPKDLVANFEDSVAVVTMSGSPPRNGHWYAYNDGYFSGSGPTCLQTPAAGMPYATSVPPSFDGTSNNARALHAQWTGCSVWGAGVGADLNEPVVAGGGIYMGAKIPYDLTGYTGVTFWAMSSPTSDNKLRVKLLMTDETRIADGGNCDEVVVGTNKCSDDWGMVFSLPTNGCWQQITVTFSDTTRFKQEGWGAPFAWNPGHVISIQFQSQGSEVGQLYDIYLDDIYLTR
jgi:hypothetical protein